MSNDKEKWMEEVFDSMKGSQRAQPRPELFAEIEAHIKKSKGKVISLQQWRTAAAAAALLLLANTTALIYYHQLNETVAEDAVVANAYDQPFISTYEIYE